MIRPRRLEGEVVRRSVKASVITSPGFFGGTAATQSCGVRGQQSLQSEAPSTPGEDGPK